MLTLGELAVYLEGECYGDKNVCLQGIAGLSRAKSHELSYIQDPVQMAQLKQTKAGAVLLLPSFLEFCPVDAIVVRDPYLSLVKAQVVLRAEIPIETGIHPSAFVHPDAILARGVSVGPHSSIGKNVSIGEGVSVGANTVIEDNVRIAENSSLGSQVCIHSGTGIGREVHVDSGVVLGAAPFNHSKYQGAWLPGLASGGVIISDQVKIGANVVIDRGALNDTYIASGVCIDNLVHIAHDVKIGARTSIAASAVIGACTEIGAHCIIGGSSCLAPNIVLCDDVVITGMSTVAKSIHKADIYSSGTTVSEHKHWRKNASRFRHLDTYIRQLKRLQEKLK